MAKLPPIKVIRREDVRDAPDWITLLLYPLNLFMTAVYLALNKGLTFDDNIISQKQKFTITAGATAINNTASFLLHMNKKPEYLLLGDVVARTGNYAPIGAAVFVEWTFDGTHVNITSVTGLTNGTIYDFSVLIL